MLSKRKELKRQDVLTHWKLIVMSFKKYMFADVSLGKSGVCIRCGLAKVLNKSLKENFT